MLGALSPREAAHLLRLRAVGLEAQLAGREQVLSALAKSGLPRLHTVEVEYLLAMCRAELPWVQQLSEDIASGDLPWTDRGSPKHASEGDWG